MHENSYIEKKITPMTIVKDLRNYKITDDEAINQIEQCIQEAIHETIEKEKLMGKEELKETKDYVAELLWERYDIPAKGNAKLINETIQEGLKKLGLGSDFRKVQKKHYNKLKDSLWDIV